MRAPPRHTASRRHGFNKRQKVRENALTAITPGWIKLDENRKPVLIEERAKVVRRIVKDTLRGVGPAAIEKALNTEGVPTFGRAPSGDAPVLQDPDQPCAGWDLRATRSRTCKGQGSPGAAGARPRLLSRSHRCGHLRTHSGHQKVTKARGRHAVTPLRSILSGLARCPECDAVMTRVNKGEGPKGTVSLVCTRAKARCRGGGPLPQASTTQA